MRTELEKWQNTLLGILFFGSMWGFFEVVLGTGLNTIHFPFRAGLLLGMGMLTMGTALALHQKPVMLIGIGVISGLIKLLSVPLLQIPLACKANSFVAVVLEALALSLVASGLMGGIKRGVPMRIGSGALAALIGAGGFYFVGMRVAPCSYLKSFSPLGFMIREGLSWMTFSAILLPLGYLFGLRFRPTMAHLLTAKSTFGYVTCLTISAVCWAISALTIVAVGP